MKDKLKKIDLKKIIKGFSILWFLALVTLMTVANLGLKEDFKFIDWLGNELILVGIMVFGLLMGESVGCDKQLEKVNGLYQNSLMSYNVFLDDIKGILIYFIQFFQWFMASELFDKKVNYLVMNNVEISKAKAIVKYCSIADLKDLSNHTIEKEDIEGNKVYIRPLDELQIEAAKEVLGGKILLDASNPNYYLSAFGKSNSKSVLEVGKQLDKEIKFNKTSNRILKIVISLVVSLIFSLFTTKDFMRGDDIQAWVNLVLRIAALLTSLLSGWMSSVVEVKLRAEKLINKLKVLTLFKNAMDKKVFVPLNENELAKKEYEIYLKKQEEKTKNTIIPELVNGNEMLKIEG